MSSEMSVASNQIVVLGGGFKLDSLGDLELSIETRQRLDRTAEYYFANQNRFDQDDGIIVCTGWQTPSWIDTVTPAYMHQADVDADYLMAQGVPYRVIEKEMDSLNTLGNVLNTFFEGYIKIGELSPDNPVGFISHPHHLKRVAFFANKLGISNESIQPIPTRQSDANLREFLSRTAWRTLLIGAEGPDRLNARFELATKLGGRVVSALRLKLIKLPF